MKLHCNLHPLWSTAALVVRNLPAKCRRSKRHRFDPLVRKILWRRPWQPTPIFLPGESPWTEGPGGLQSIMSQRIGHDWATKRIAHMSNFPVLLSVQFSRSVMSDSLRPHEPHAARKIRSKAVLTWKWTVLLLPETQAWHRRAHFGTMINC